MAHDPRVVIGVVATPLALVIAAVIVAAGYERAFQQTCVATERVLAITKIDSQTMTVVLSNQTSMELRTRPIDIGESVCTEHSTNPR